MKTFLHSVLVMLIATVVASNAEAQLSAKSLLINHGSSGCGNANAEQQFFSGSLTSTPSLVYSGNVGLPYGGVFSAYNPADQKIYFADINGTGTKVYVINYNFGGTLTTPVVSAPTYTYNYVVNQLCFDNAGNNYGFKSFNPSDGKAKIEKIDITDGSTIGGSMKSLQFPSGHIPNTVGDGDMVILPNGRFFATFGNSPSMLYEFTQKPDGNYNVNFLTNMPRTCYSIAYVDGNLTVAGSDGGGCYYYIWDINSVALSNAYTYPGGKSSADMSNLTAGVGVTNLLSGMRSISSNTAQINYQIVLKNKGNVYLNNVQLVENLNDVFGAGNVSNVQINFGSNPAGFQLNPAYNGTTVTNMLVPGLSLDNEPVTTDSVVINLTVTATNLVPNKVYYNSALASGNLGTGTSYLSVSDSSNNGGASRMDLDNNGVSDDPGENVPTPFVFVPGLLPVSGLSLQGVRHDDVVKLTWNAASANEFSTYEIERSTDGISFQTRGTVAAQADASYSFSDDISGSKSAGVFYRIKGIKDDNTIAFSNTFYSKNGAALGVSVYPNPFSTSVSVQLQTVSKGTAAMTIKDVAGRTIVSKALLVEKGTNYITVPDMQNAQPGTYFMETVCGGEKAFVKLVKQ